MNKYFYGAFIILTFALLTPTCNAQEFEGGVIGGLLGSQVAGDVSTGYNKLGAYFGIFSKRQFSLKSGAQLEMYFIQKGARENPTEENGETQYLLKVNYIEIPLLYLYRINEKLELSGGLALSYKIGDHYEEFGYSSLVSNAGFNSTSFTFVLGINYGITERISASFRTNNSISPIRPHVSGAKRFSNRGQYSDALTLGLVYHIF